MPEAQKSANASLRIWLKLRFSANYATWICGMRVVLIQILRYVNINF